MSRPGSSPARGSTTSSPRSSSPRNPAPPSARIQGYERREQRARLETLQLLAKTLEIEVRDIATLRTADSDDDARSALPTRRGVPAPAVLLPRTQLETLVDLERAAGIEPATVETPRGPAQTLTAKGLQDVFTAYALHEGARFCLTGKVEGMRGLPRRKRRSSEAAAEWRRAFTS